MKSLNKNLIVELAVFSAVLLAVNSLLFHGDMFGFNPSPLWFIVVFISMRHGSPAGTISGCVAAALHLWNLTQSGHSFQELLHLNPGMLVVPALFILVGMYLGENRERLGKRADHFQASAEELTRQLDANEIKRLNLERGRVEMEKRIAGQTDTLLAVYENLNRLNNSRSEQELWNILTEIALRELRAEACGIWRSSPPQLLAVTGALPEIMPPLASLAFKRRKVVTAADWAEIRGPDEAPGAELAAPLIQDVGQPVVIALSGIGFGNLNRSAAILFNLLVERASFLIQELRRLEGLRRISISDPELGLTSESYLRIRVREQILLAKRHKTELAILSCALDAAPPKRLEDRLEVILACSIRAAVRASDGIAFFPDSKAFVVLLPQSDLSGAGVVMRKILANLDTLDIRDADEEPLTRLKWNAIPLDGSVDDGEMYRNLFAGMRAREEVAV